MPFKSEAQRRLMEAVRTNPATAKKTGVPQSVGQKFHAHGKVGALPERIGKKTKTLKRNSEHWS
jgi:hypothetical protein